jgi:hypothetical protein
VVVFALVLATILAVLALSSCLACECPTFASRIDSGHSTLGPVIECFSMQGRLGLSGMNKMSSIWISYQRGNVLKATGSGLDHVLLSH